MKNAMAMVFVVSLLPVACGGGGSAKSAWQDVIKRCARSDLNGKKILFFGPSNAVGAGSVWRQDAQGVYRLRYDLGHMPKPQDFLAPYTPLACDGTTSKKFKGAINGTLDQQGVLSAEASAEIAKARSVTAKAASVAWVPIAEGPYDSYVKGVAANSDAGRDLLSGTRQVMTRAFMVSGFSAKITFDQSTGAAVKAKLPPGALLPSAVGGGLSVSWSETGELTLTSVGDFYIAGELQSYRPDGFSGAGSSRFGVATTFPTNAEIGRDQ